MIQNTPQLTKKEIQRFTDKLIKRVKRFQAKEPDIKLNIVKVGTDYTTGELKENATSICLLGIINYKHAQPKKTWYSNAAAKNLNIEHNKALELESGFMGTKTVNNYIPKTDYETIGYKVGKHFSSILEY